MPADPNPKVTIPGSGKCMSKADCRPDDVCHRWECIDSFCTPFANYGGAP
jgi:hypothetical protein